MADTDYNGVLSFSEYVDFLHPEDAEHMRDIVVMETIEDIDKDKDGFISEIEYIGTCGQINIFIHCYTLLMY